MEIRPQLIAWSHHMVRSLPKEATFEMRAKQQAGASWTEIRVKGQAEGTAGAKGWMEVGTGSACLISESPPLSVRGPQFLASKPPKRLCLSGGQFCSQGPAELGGEGQ